ncbi:hypothetical protein Aph01nite_43230 [Acrocarpospora phusangensis]|uniref:Uncharacterized protein n=1 Tax=Acrocarpospora phusangensis TaxID=1070424 RepID=A0A919UQ38_9ACTN|nr:hypothetical protein [Acrocarpospora phusangensis]GIH26013.1 hypothetical protein Aph01nite_43230 [Acrocarpospora phusangensis]
MSDERDYWQEYKDEQLMGPPREEPDWDDDYPVDLDEVQTRHEAAMRTESTAIGEDAQFVMWEAVPRLIAELRAARADLGRWQSLARRYEYAITADGSVPPQDAPLVAPEATDPVVNDPSLGKAWQRAVLLPEWTELGLPPF